MSEITNEQIEYLAKLSRIGLKKDEVKRYRTEISSVLSYFQQLDKLNIKNVQPTSQATDMVNVFREDIFEKDENSRDELLANVPKRKDEYIRVKSVLE